MPNNDDQTVRGYVATSEGQIHYRQRGTSGPPVVFLHQTASSSAMWERVMELFPPGYRLIALDTPGFGMSDGPSSIPEEGLSYYAERVAQAVDGLGIDRFCLVGHHTGAMIAAEFAATYAHRVEGLVLIGCVVIESEEEGQRHLQDVDRWEADARGEFVSRNLVPRMQRIVKSDDPAQFLVEMTALLNAGPHYWWAYEAVFSYDAPERLPLISAPALCVVGDREPGELGRWTRLAADLIPNGLFQELPDAGGSAVMEEPAVVTSVVYGLVAHCTPAPPDTSQ